MGGARALIASLGASISLVAGAAVSLLLLSVFALPGFTAGDDGPDRSAAVEIAARVSTQPPAGGAPVRDASTPVLIDAPRSARTAGRREHQAPVVPREVASDKPSFDAGVPDFSPPPPPPPAAPSAPKSPVGKGVRDFGDAVTATVKGTGAAAAPLLGPPVSQAIQDVLDLLTSVLQGATGALGAALDKTIPR